MAPRELGEVFGFTAEDLKANRRGTFSANQHQQMTAVVQGTVRPLMVYGGAFFFVAFIALLLINSAGGDSPLARLASVVISFLLMLLLLVGGGLGVMLSRTRNRMRVVNRHTGVLRRHITGDGTLHISVDDLAFQAQVTDPEQAQALLQDGEQYAVYFMGAPPVVSLLSLERRAG